MAPSTARRSSGSNPSGQARSSAAAGRVSARRSRFASHAPPRSAASPLPVSTAPGPASLAGKASRAPSRRIGAPRPSVTAEADSAAKGRWWPAPRRSRPASAETLASIRSGRPQASKSAEADRLTGESIADSGPRPGQTAASCAGRRAGSETPSVMLMGWPLAVPCRRTGALNSPLLIVAAPSAMSPPVSARRRSIRASPSDQDRPSARSATRISPPRTRMRRSAAKALSSEGGRASTRRTSSASASGLLEAGGASAGGASAVEGSPRARLNSPSAVRTTVKRGRRSSTVAKARAPRRRARTDNVAAASGSSPRTWPSASRSLRAERRMSSGAAAPSRQPFQAIAASPISTAAPPSSCADAARSRAWAKGGRGSGPSPSRRNSAARPSTAATSNASSPPQRRRVAPDTA
jgi:hypothetical protein